MILEPSACCRCSSTASLESVQPSLQGIRHNAYSSVSPSRLRKHAIKPWKRELRFGYTHSAKPGDTIPVLGSLTWLCASPGSADLPIILQPPLLQEKCSASLAKLVRVKLRIWGGRGARGREKRESQGARNEHTLCTTKEKKKIAN